MVGTQRPLRADARRNRERILAAARAVLAESGLGASVDDIAIRAGVGVGTIYRRFGDRDGLIRHILLDSVHTLTTAAQETGGDTDPVDRFALAALEVRLGVLAPVLAPVMSEALRSDETFQQARARLLDAVDDMLRQAQQFGRLRNDVSAADFLLALASAAAPLPGGVDAEQTWRTITILLDGFRTAAPTKLPGRTVTRAELDRTLLEQ